ncbi:MAG: tyrosine-type recombinase/integrase, partial [Phycisphaerae bacterium]|nr:tyrosine-type recombinase/integrase [Phycisphaerae bacterium]
KTVRGVSFHKATGRYYVYDHRGKQVYFKSWREARDAYRRLNGDPVAIAKGNAAYAVRHAAMQHPEIFARLVAMFGGSPPHAQVMIDVSHPDSRIRKPDGSFDRDGLSIEPFADRIGVPEFEVVEAGSENTDAHADVRKLATADNPRLVDVGEAWLRHKMNERGLEYVDRQQRAAMCKAGKRSPLSNHMRDTLASWRAFVDCVGNARIAELTPAHFRRFHQWADRESASKASNRWHGQLMTAVKNIFNYAQRYYADWAWPPGINERIRAYTPKKYQAAASNAEPMPPKVFQQLLAQCDKWAATDPEEFDKSTQSGRARRLQALRKQREGRQMRVILELTINCGLNAVDCERIRWSNLKLDGTTPHMDLPRRKTESSTGRATERRTPLLPQVVRSLESWRAAESPRNGLVFYTSHATPVNAESISRAVKRLCDDAGLSGDFTYKHLRNVGSTLASDHDLPEEKIQRFLGHRPTTVSSRYKIARGPEYLQPVVDLIAEHYFKRP